jgi:PTH2 family peptidyl-tRNA hydrolase
MEHCVGIRVNELDQPDQPTMYMYFLVNDDLKMGKGKIAGQVAHVAGLITETIIRQEYESLRRPDCYTRYMQWKLTGHTKVVLKASQAQIEEMLNEPESMYIRDSGKTQIAPNSLTVIGFYPSSDLKEKFAKFKLL